VDTKGERWFLELRKEDWMWERMIRSDSVKVGRELLESRGATEGGEEEIDAR